MKRPRHSTAILLIAVVIAAGSLLGAGVASAQVVAGVQEGPVAAEPAASTGVESSPGMIDFDDAVAPCTFSSTVALTDEYSALNVVFAGPGGNDGGAILDECSSFGVSGHSAPNFLAFNIDSSLSDGGIPQGPETITFSIVVDTVQLLAGSSQAGTISLECFDGGGGSVGSDSVTGTDALQSLSVSASGQIVRCSIGFTGSWLVVDDLQFNPVPVELQSFSIQ